MNTKSLQDKMKNCVTGKLPASISDRDVEFFCNGDEVIAIIANRMIPSTEWPEWLYEAVEKDMVLHPEAIESLVQLGLSKRLELIEQYIKCRYSVLDFDPDVIGGVLQQTEYVDCNLRGSCPFEGRLCELLKAPFGTLTQREIEVLRQVVEGLLDKEIADKLGTSPLTIPVHMKNLRAKIGARNRAELIRFAVNKNLL